MPYYPSDRVGSILSEALSEVRAVPYAVTARWVFYRLLQAGTLNQKGDYKKLLSYLSRARKEWYGGWTPDTLTDDTREAVVRGGGFDSPQDWADAIARQECSLDRWKTQETYVEVWFEAAAMTAQFQFYVNENIPLLAFHGDISIPAKWDAAVRLVRRWREMRKPIHIMYYGDLDPKGLQIPESAHTDVRQMMVDALFQGGSLLNSAERNQEYRDMHRDFTFERVGLTDQQVDDYGVPENPERPGTYQWEGLDDDAAQEMIGLANEVVDEVSFTEVQDREDSVTQRFRAFMSRLEIDEDDDEQEEEE